MEVSIYAGEGTMPTQNGGQLEPHGDHRGRVCASSEHAMCWAEIVSRLGSFGP
jgi:hypothetical protein